MAEGISIPVNIRPGDLSGLTAIARELEKTRRQLSLATEQATTPTLSEWEALPGGGIRRRGRATQPGAGTYNTPPMIPSGGRTGAPPVSPATVPSAPAPARSDPSGSLPGMPPAGGSVTPATTFQQGTQAVRGYAQSLRQANQQASALHGTLQHLGRSATLGAATGAAVPPSTAGARPLSGRALEILGAPAAGRGVPPVPPGAPPPSSAGIPPVPPPRVPPAAAPPSPAPTDDEHVFMPAWMQRGVGAVRRGARAVLGVTAGVGIYQTLTHAMSLYEQRAHGIIAIGMQLDQNFAQVGGTIDRLRTNYQVLAHDSIGAMQAMGQVTNRLAGLDEAVAFGAAYGIAAPTVGHMAGLAQRLTTGPNPLAAMGGSGSTLYGVNYQAMPMEPLIDEQLSMAQLGGQVGVRMPASYYGHMASMIGGMGEQMQVPGAISQFFGQYAQGLAQAPDEGIYAMRMQALVRLREQRQAQGQGTKLRIGEADVDLGSTFGMETAMEAGIFSPEVQEAYRQQALAMTGGREDLMPRTFWNMLGGRQIGRLKSEQLRQSADKQPGGLLSLRRPGSAITGATEANVEDRLARRQVDEFEPQRLQAQYEGGLETAGRVLVTLSNELRKALAEAAIAAREGTIDIMKLGDGIRNMSAGSVAALGFLTTLSSQSMVGQMAGAAMMTAGAGRMAGPGLWDQITETAKQGWDRFHLLLPGALPLNPQQQGP